ncbi:glycosyltransferase [Oxynema sp. CENA135]|uniref:glycosyltransferase family 2 protein n=1 Tax=Oxynema sp. CENA135 TaxID=984206 RepID=UPI00190D49E7|nr:glycosyltransferase [Oxynema sp. CENA135]MBK4729295.1 glycosyltransferase [Oxynema sp. CENA135]
MLRNSFARSPEQLIRLQRLSKRFYESWKTKGTRYALARVFKKIYYKLDETPLPSQGAPEVAHPLQDYHYWLSQNSARAADLRQKAQTLKVFPYQPLISILMPVYNPPERFLRTALDSVLDQVYPNWELCIADDASSEAYIKTVLEEYAEKDSRIKVTFREKNGHISAASNTALEMATGEYVALLDHDDMLNADALYEVALMLNLHPEADMIYSDEDKVDDNNQLRDPFFKPDWCPDSFLSRMYTCHLGTYRRSLVNEIGGFRVGFEGSQDYDLVLRLTEKTDKIYHIPKILYHWRIHSQSTASELENKSYATDAAFRAIAEALERRGEPGRVEATEGGHAIVRYHIQDYRLVTVIIPTRNYGSTLNTCLTSIFEKTTYPNYEVLVIDNGSTEPETLEVFNKWKAKEPDRFRCEPLDIPFNFSKINNYAVTQAKGDYLLFLNNDTEAIYPDWMTAMVEQVQRPSIGAVGALLLYPDSTIQHAGVVIGLGGVAGHSHKNFPSGVPGYYFQLKTVNNYSAVTAACLMCRREVFEEIGGFEEENLKIAFNDVDLCLKMVEKGYRNLYLPHVVLYHYESKSRGFEDTPEKIARFSQEIDYMREKWKTIIDRDPCYSPNLTRDREDYSINL